jgi:hypothetical protein
MTKLSLKNTKLSPFNQNSFNATKPVGYDISPLKRIKFKFLTTSRQASG